MTAETYYASGHCAVGAHGRCRGLYSGVTCQCACGHQPPEPVRGLRIGSLFSGYGGLEQGVQSVLGGAVAWHSDIDPGACKILAHRYPDVPNLGDITAVDWSAVEPVDVLTGGFPCQDVSCAGLRKGMRPDTRSGLWTQMAYAIDQLRPSLVVIENVRGLLSAEAHSDLEPCPWCVGDGSGGLLRALGAVLGDLADIGYDASWQGLRAADVGAPHGRFRVFVTAWPADSDPAGLGRWAPRWYDRVRAAGLVAEPADTHVAGLEGGEPAAGRLLPDGRAAADAGRLRGHTGRLAAPGQAPGRRALGQPAGRDGAPAAHASSEGRHEGWTEPARLVGGSDAALGGDAAADTDRDGLVGLEGAPRGRDALRADEWDDADRCSDAAATDSQSNPGRFGDGDGLPAVEWGPYTQAIRRWERLTRPAPAPTEPGAKGQPRLSPAFVEWMQGLPAGWVTDVPGLSRNEQLKALGNGVVPQQAEAALRLLLAHQMEVAA